jgi:hypothetical protein
MKTREDDFAERGVQTYAYDPETCPSHPPASTLKACACSSCGAWIWEGVALCTGLVGDTGVCTRPLNHEGRCEERDLRGGEAPS